MTPPWKKLLFQNHKGGPDPQRIVMPIKNKVHEIGAIFCSQEFKNIVQILGKKCKFVDLRSPKI
jgi:hypothetical protein